MDQIRHIGLPDGRSFVHHHGTAGAGDISEEDDEIEQARDIVDAIKHQVADADSIIW
jgi:hypothetical protein